MHATRRHLLASAAALGLSGCAGLGGPPTVTLAPDEIERLLERRFPLDRRLLEVFDVTLSRPQVRMLADRNRLAATLDLDTRERLFGGQWKGRLDFDAALRWEASDRSVRLAQVRVQDFTLDRAGGAARSGAERLGGALVERVIEDLSIYTLSAERAERMRAAGLTPGAVSVTSRGVEITFERAPR